MLISSIIFSAFITGFIFGYLINLVDIIDWYSILHKKPKIKVAFQNVAWWYLLHSKKKDENKKAFKR